MRSMLKRVFANRNGAAAIEYALVATLVSLAAVAAMTVVGSNLSGVFGSIGASL